MLKKLFVIGLAAVTCVSNAAYYVDDASAPFDASEMRTNKAVSVKWETATNIQKACIAKGEFYGLKKHFNPDIRACAFWRDNMCIIITGKTTTLHSVGHEIRHCFQGDWHPQ